MIASVKYSSKTYKINLSEPLDISIPLRGGEHNVNAWYLDAPRIEPHQEGDFVGKVSQGGSTNFNDIWFNPHSHMTHTECLGHITEAFHSINQKLERFFFLAEVVTVAPEKYGDDYAISAKQLKYALGTKKREAMVIRTIPNPGHKRTKHYSNTNPPYLLEEAAHFLAEKGIAHLLVDLPSVDKEKDGGAMLAHSAFWGMDRTPRPNATITEFIYIADTIGDGCYFLNLQVAPFENDAAPSRPVLYKIEP